MSLWYYGEPCYFPGSPLSSLPFFPPLRLPTPCHTTGGLQSPPPVDLTQAVLEARPLPGNGACSQAVPAWQRRPSADCGPLEGYKRHFRLLNSILCSILRTSFEVDCATVYTLKLAVATQHSRCYVHFRAIPFTHITNVPIWKLMCFNSSLCFNNIQNVVLCNLHFTSP